jgi:hypothetical protein
MDMAEEVLWGREKSCEKSVDIFLHHLVVWHRSTRSKAAVQKPPAFTPNFTLPGNGQKPVHFKSSVYGLSTWQVTMIQKRHRTHISIIGSLDLSA